LDLNIDKKLTDADKKIENLKDKINKENNNLLFGQQEENKAKEKDNEAKEKDNKDQDDNDQNLGIAGLDSKIQKIQANLEKQIEKLKDKFENDRDNQRLIEQRNEFDGDDDDDDDGDSKDDDDDDGKNYDGYGFNGNNDDGKENGEENFNFAAAGDFGCSTNTENTVENMQSKEPEIVLALGDLSYHSTADCWFDMMSPIKDKLMITLGHHDVEDGQAKMDQYLNSFGLEKPFYSYEYNKVHFLVMSAKSVYYKGSEQYNFILEDLKKAAENKDVNWIVVSSYGPPYTSPSEHTAFKELRDVYHPIFEKYGVDLVLSGHNHNYQRTHPITYNPNDSSEPVVTNDRTTEYNSQKDGIVFAIVGTGGVNFYSFDGQAPFVDTQFANKFGFLNIDISNGNPHTKLTGTFYDNKGDQILDQFTIGKEIKNKTSEVISN
jgi:predicted phosphodiesterase